MRSTAWVKDFIKARIAANPLISTLADNPDFDSSLIGQFIECIAEEIADHSIIMADHMAAIEDRIAITNAHTATWVKEKAFEFQYSEDAPQTLEEIEGLVQYPVIDEALRIITHCAVRTGAPRLANVYVAKNTPQEKLTALELQAAETYFNSILSVSNVLAGVRFDVISLDPDICFIKGVVYHDGQYSVNIQDNVTEAIENYLAQPSLDGFLSVHGLTQAVLAVEGVRDFVIEDLGTRGNGTGFGTTTYTVQAKTLLGTTPISLAGWYITEVESGEELATRLTYTSL